MNLILTPKKRHNQMSLQMQYFLLSYLKTLSVGPTGFRALDLPLSRPALSHWANQAVAWLTITKYPGYAVLQSICSDNEFKRVNWNNKTVW